LVPSARQAPSGGPSPVTPASDADGRQPWLARHPRLIGTAAFLVALFLTSMLHKAWPATAGDRLLALPVHLRIDGHGAPGSPLGLVVPLVLIAASWLLRAWARGSQPSNSALAPSGAYAFIRHPRKAGAFLLALAFGLFLPPPGLLIFAAVAGSGAFALAAAREAAASRPDTRSGAAAMHRTGAFWPRSWRAWPKPRPARRGLWLESWHAGVAVYLCGMALGWSWIGFAGLAWACGVGLHNLWAGRRDRAAARATTRP
jgi:hypothetical protein